jgi:hypothetical protein
MGLLIREYVKRDGRGKSRKVQVYATFEHLGIFDTPYDPAKHRHFILHELRYRTGPAPAFLGRNKKKSERLSKYGRHVSRAVESSNSSRCSSLEGILRGRAEMAREDVELVRSEHSSPLVHEKEILHEVEVIQIFLVSAWLVVIGH